MLSTVLQRAVIIDGSGQPPYTTDVGISGDRIALVGDLRDRECITRIDCAGKTLAPGFIDVHSHSDELWLILPTCDGKIAQGVTTEIAGNCGTSAAPLHGPSLERMERSTRHYGLDVTWRTLDEFFTLVEKRRTALNVATLVGLGTTRQAVSGDDERRLDDDDLRAQARIVREACEHGALGVSSGLVYPPSSYADLRELCAMAEAARDAGSPIYASHVRDEGDKSVEAIEEALRVGNRTGVTVQCSHHKATRKRNWGKVHATLALIDRARASGLNAWCDVYPYTASWTEFASILPARLRYGGDAATLKRLGDPAQARALALELQIKHHDEWHDMLITEVGSEQNAGLAGMRLDEIARFWAMAPAEAAIRLLREERLEAGAIFFRMNEDDVAAVLSADFCCIGSDASIRGLHGVTARGVPHPRTFGTFPRVYKRFVRQRKTLELPDAVRRMTALPAKIFGLRGRGSIAPGMFADLAIFDSNAIGDTATYEAPYSFPDGIERVIVNGTTVYSGGQVTGELPGRVLRNGG